MTPRDDGPGAAGDAADPAPVVTATLEAPEFNPEYFQTVFLVPDPARAWPRRFAIVTAHNPDGRPQSREANERAARELVEHLGRRGLETFAVTGASADLGHQEHGQAFVADLATAANVAARFRQEAFFWIEDDVAWICVDASGRGWRVARWSERVREAPPSTTPSS